MRILTIAVILAALMGCASLDKTELQAPCAGCGEAIPINATAEA